VEAQQCVKLTGTNRSIGLIVLIVHAHRPAKTGDDAKTCSKLKTKEGIPFTSFSILPLADLVVMAGWLHPFPFRTRP
jgi:hypothetical protein